MREVQVDKATHQFPCGLQLDILVHGKAHMMFSFSLFLFPHNDYLPLVFCCFLRTLCVFSLHISLLLETLE
jgi:hypothetical protein